MGRHELLPSRRQAPPPVGAWDKLTLHAAHTARMNGRWTAPLQSALGAAANALAFPSLALSAKIRLKGWTDPEAMIHGWARDRRLEAILDRDADLLILRPRERKGGSKGRPVPPSGPTHPLLFDLGG